MLDYRLTFQSPGYLPLLVLIPVLLWWSYRRLAALGRWRRIFALTLRAIVLLLLVFALAEAQWVRASNRLTVLYLLIALVSGLWTRYLVRCLRSG